MTELRNIFTTMRYWRHTRSSKLDMTKLQSMQAGLPKKDDELEAARMSSTDRAKRHGELKQLRTLKREIMKKVYLNYLVI